MQSLRFSRLDFASVLSYTPRAGSGGPAGRQSRDLMLALKQGRVSGAPPTSVSTRMAAYLANSLESFPPLVPFFRVRPVVVPLPKSALHREGSLWIPEELAAALVATGLASRSARLLERTRAIPKAATSRPSERPTASLHYQTLAVQTDLTGASEFLLVDDIVTSGAALLGAANRVMESYPGVPVRGFAAMRTVSNPEEFGRITDPVTGTITLQRTGRCLRRP